MRSSLLRGFFCLTMAMVASGVAAAAETPPPLIARDVLFGNPERIAPQLSPDGKRLAWLAPDTKNVLQVWVKTVALTDKSDEKMVTADKKRGIRGYFWAKDNRTLLYIQDADGDENWHVYGVDLTSGTVRDLTPFQGVNAAVIAVNEKFPHALLVQMNVRNKALHDVYRCDLETGALTLDTQNPGDVAGWIVDNHMVVRGAQISLPDGGTELRVRDSVKGPWRTLLKASMEENLAFYGFTPDGKRAYLSTSLGSDTARLVEHDLKTGAEKTLAQRDDVDIGGVVEQPRTEKIQAVSFMPGRLVWTIIDPSIKDDFAAIQKVMDADVNVVSRDEDDQTWLVAYQRDRGPISYYTYSRATKQATFMFVHQPKLNGLTLAEMKPYTIDARDGWGYNPSAQWLANRGYAVLQVNYRGSTGYGKKFLHLGDKQWGKTMHTDLLDSVNWMVKQGWVDPKRVAIMGGSYGGYAALAGAAFTPDFFKCSVDIVGPSNLFTLLKTIPPYWKPMIAVFYTRMGDPEKDQALLHAASPLFSADKIKIPMLIGQGANDPRVNQAESEQIVSALEKNGQHAVYVLYPDEGHGFARPENRIDFNARAEKFLSEQLGGRYEPLKGDKIPGATAIVREVGKKAAQH